MNKNQKIVILIGVVIFFLIGIYPPLLLTSAPENSALLEGFYKYSFIWSRSYNDGWCKIDLNSLIAEWITAAFVIGGLILYFDDRRI
jgi:hypothetical protein